MTRQVQIKLSVPGGTLRHVTFLNLVSIAAAVSLLLLLGYVAGRGQGRSERSLLWARIGQLEADRERHAELEMALAPLSSSLARVERQVAAHEKERAAQLGSLTTRLDAVHAAGEALRTQTAALAGALNAPSVRGSWGEVQLRRVVEHAGMLARVDFDVQVAGRNDDGQEVRPDAVVRLPGGKHVVVDAKAPLAAYLSAAAQVRPGEEPAKAARRREAAAADHAKSLRRHVEALAAKRYWTAFTPSPELVVCFVPGESFLASACEVDPALLEHAMARKVVLATPSTLLALLRTVAASWQHDALAGSARELLDVGKELYARLGGLGDQLGRLGKSLDRAVAEYNATVGTLERRVLVSARRMQTLGLDDAAPPSPSPVLTAVRHLAAPELLDTEGVIPERSRSGDLGTQELLLDDAAKVSDGTRRRPGAAAS